MTYIFAFLEMPPLRVEERVKMKMKLIAAVLAATTLATTSVNAQTLNGNDIKVSTKGGLKVESGEYKFQIGGRLQYDYSSVDLNGSTVEDEFDVRRARIFLSGNVAKDWKFKAQFNLDGDGGDDNFEDLYIRYTGFGKAANITIGNQKLPFSLEEQTSSKDISILERSAVTEQHSIGRAESIQLHGKFGGAGTYGVSAFLDEDDEGDEDLGFAGRITYAPIKTDNSVLHLGLGYLTIEEDNALGFEAAYSSGPFHIQGEYLDGEDGNVDTDGFYVQAGFVLTGETRPYSGGKFKRITPKSKAGAWELVARYEDGDGDFGDLEDFGVSDPVEGSAYTLGVNWYAHKNIRFGINYSDGDSDVSDDDAEEIRARIQITY